jgi:hypothetical protein
MHKLSSTIAALLLASLAPKLAAQNLLANPSFEGGLAGWGAFGNSFYEPTNLPAIDPRSGTGLLKMFGNFSGGFNVSGVFQSFPAAAGQTFTLDCWSRHFSGDPMLGVGLPNDNWAVMKIAFFNAGGTEIGSAEQVILDGTKPVDTWIDNPEVTGVAPAGTASVQALLLYLQPAFAGGAAQFDDVTFSSPPSGRTMSSTGNQLIGSTINAQINHPTTAAGNLCGYMFSLAYPLVIPGAIPGFNWFGDIRVDFANLIYFPISVFDATGVQNLAVSLPNDPFLVGTVIDCQSIDLDIAANTLYFADNELNITFGEGLGTSTIEFASATTTSLTVGNNDLRRVTNATIGAPISSANPGFSYLPVRHRGEEGFVEGMAGTFSSTSHNSEMDSVSYRRNGRRTTNGAYQTINLVNGREISIIRDLANPKQFSLLSYNKADGVATIIPGSTWVDTGTAVAPTQQNFYFGFSRDGQWGSIYVKDSNTTTGFLPMVWAFRTDGSQPVVDITPAGMTLATSFFDGSLIYSNDFLVAFGAAGTFWTSATAPAQMQPLNLGNTTFSNLPNIWAFPFDWRVSPNGSTIYMPIGSNATASRGEMDIIQIANNGGTPQVTNWTQFPAATGLAAFGYGSYTPSTVSNSSTGIKCSVSPDSSKVAILAATTVTTVFPGIYVADGTPNPVLYSVPGAVYYSDVAFINNTTVVFLAGAVPAAGVGTALYKLDLTAGNQAGVITQLATPADIKSRGSWYSGNKNYWYFVRSNGTNSSNNIIGVNCATGATFNVTGDELAFGPASSVGNLLSGSFNATSDPWFCLEMQLRRAPVGDFAYFTARRINAAGVEDSNVFRFDMENGGQAVALTNNTATGTGAGSVINIESLTISEDGNHVAYTQRIGTSSTAATPENVWHLDLATNVATQLSTSNPLGQTIVDGSVRFVNKPAAYGGGTLGVVWSLGTGTATTVPTANGIAQFAPLGVAGAPITLTGAPAGTRFYQVLGSHF